MRRKNDDRPNLCTVSLHIAPEARGTGDIRLQYDCIKEGLLTRACRYFKPMTCAGGLKCHGECEYFENGCKNRTARAAARKRAEAILKVQMSK